jgi:TolB-like protein/Flp pilus assembly protein TadD
MAPPEQISLQSEGTSLVARSKGSIAVLPFRNLSGRPEQDYLANGLATDIISLLSKISNLVVISSHSSFWYANSTKNPHEIGKELGVQFLLVGSLSTVEGKLTIEASLVDIADSGRGWTMKLENEPGNALSIRNKLTRKIVSAMATKIMPPVANLPEPGGTKSPAAHDAFLQGWEHYMRRTAEDMARAAAHFKSAIVLDDDFARARAALAATYLVSRRHLWHKSLGFESKYEAESAARTALRAAMVNPTPLAHRVSASLYVREHRVDEAISEIERAVALDPNDPENYALLSITLNWAGRPKEAVDAIDAAMRLDPFYPARYQSYLGIAKYHMGKFKDAFEHLQRAHRRDSENYLVLAHLLAAQGQLGKLRGATTTLSKLNDLRLKKGLQPYSMWEAQHRTLYKNQTDVARFIDGLRKARVPEK